LYCAHHAIEQTGLTTHELSQTGTFIGTSLGGYPEQGLEYQTFYAGEWRKMPALGVLRGMPNSIANHVAIAFGLGGPNSTISNACVSSAEAIGNAYQQIAHGRLSTAVCGGSESFIWEPMMAAWCKLRVMSTHNERPEVACKPFDKHRDGMVIADGAAILVLEELEQAQARGATIYGEILGYGASCDAHHITAPHSEGQVRAIHAALDDARLAISDVQYINAHGTGTTLNDCTETASIKQVFGDYAHQIPITAQKSMTGHAIGASGAMEIIATTLSLQHDTLLPTINLTEADPLCDLDYVPNESRSKRIDIALSNHFAFGGANAAILLRRF
jgi:3-oxoacyl-[acyl-carrier-protein] synthase II